MGKITELSGGNLSQITHGTTQHLLIHYFLHLQKLKNWSLRACLCVSSLLSFFLQSKITR